MGVAENKALIPRFYEEVWDRGNFEFARDVFADDYVRHDLRPTHALPGAAGMAKIAADFRRAFPDLPLACRPRAWRRRPRRRALDGDWDVHRPVG